MDESVSFLFGGAIGGTLLGVAVTLICEHYSVKQSRATSRIEGTQKIDYGIGIYNKPSLQRSAIDSIIFGLQVIELGAYKYSIFDKAQSCLKRVICKKICPCFFNAHNSSTNWVDALVSHEYDELLRIKEKIAAPSPELDDSINAHYKCTTNWRDDIENYQARETAQSTHEAETAPSGSPLSQQITQDVQRESILTA